MMKRAQTKHPLTHTDQRLQQIVHGFQLTTEADCRLSGVLCSFHKLGLSFYIWSVILLYLIFYLFIFFDQICIAC